MAENNDAIDSLCEKIINGTLKPHELSGELAKLKKEGKHVPLDEDLQRTLDVEFLRRNIKINKNMEHLTSWVFGLTIAITVMTIVLMLAELGTFK